MYWSHFFFHFKGILFFEAIIRHDGLFIAVPAFGLLFVQWATILCTGLYLAGYGVLCTKEMATRQGKTDTQIMHTSNIMEVFSFCFGFKY